uniref:Putative secreted protein n=1 Tax=Amblyomma triste TaxID=251400 RepID=A0A023G025_AMBTT
MLYFLSFFFLLCFRRFTLCAMFTAPIKSVQVALVTHTCPLLTVQTCFVGDLCSTTLFSPTSRLHVHSKHAVTTIFSTCKTKKIF